MSGQSKQKRSRAPRHDSDLEWLFNEAETAFGVRSIDSALESMALSGVRDAGASSRDDRMRNGLVGWRARAPERGVYDPHWPAATRQRWLLRAFRACSTLSQNVLWMAFGPREWRPHVYVHLGPWAGVTLLTDAAKGAWEHAKAKNARTEVPSTVEIVVPKSYPNDNGSGYMAIREWSREFPTLGHWMSSMAPASVIREAKREAEVMVSDAYVEWKAKLGPTVTRTRGPVTNVDPWRS